MPIEMPVFTAIPQISSPPSSIAATHASTSASASEPWDAWEGSLRADERAWERLAAPYKKY